MDTELERIKQILLGQEYEALLRLKDEINDDGHFSERVAQIITEALKTRSASDDSISTVLAPTIDRAIAGSINQDPQKLAESLYPIMGPAIRKSISETLQQMLENFNQLLEQSFSPQSLRWRFDAWRTGRSYSELVLLNTLEYQIEQIFLIHRETSLLIQHVFSESIEKKDPDMVSGMLSAIQDFIEDSFSVSESDLLDTLRLGELTVVIQRGPQAILAAVVRGRVPEDLRTNMSISLESLHRLKRNQLMDYSGDPSVFVGLEEDLSTILAQEKGEKKKRKTPWLALIAVGTAMVLASIWQYNNHEKEKTFNSAYTALINALQMEPGLIVLESSNNSNHQIRINLLADPDARNPTKLSPSPSILNIEYNVKPFLSLDAPIILKRANEILKPKPGTNILIEGNKLILTGSATRRWLESTQTAWTSIAGIREIDADNLDVHDLIADEIAILARRIESVTFEFPRAGIEIDSQLPAFRSLVADMKQTVTLVRQKEMADSSYRLGLIKQGLLGPDLFDSSLFDIVGYTDESGSTAFNEQLGIQRAEALRQLLVSHGISESLMRTFSGLTYDEESLLSERKTKIVVHEADLHDRKAHQDSSQKETSPQQEVPQKGSGR